MPKPFLELFAAAVAAAPEKAAVVSDGQSLTYAELDALSDAIAVALADSGVTPGARVPLLLERGARAVAAMLGVWKAGGVLCIVSTDYPPDRIAYILEQCAAPTLLDKAWLEGVDACPGGKPNPSPADPRAPGLIVFTSGSTGRPKGVVIPHAAVSLAIRGDVLGRTAEDVFLSVASFSFVVVVMEIMMPLSLGATVHIASEQSRRDVDRLIRLVRDTGATTTFMPPQMAAQFLAVADGLLGVIVTGSEKVSRLHSSRTRIVNLFGASETCGPVTAFPIDKPYDSTPIGAAYEGSAVYILDDNLQRVATGGVGEICVAGQIALGYLNNPEQTAASFVPNPYATGPDDRTLYRTGDLGRMRADGVVEYVQRKDWMLKVRGHRVEPGEIEAVMLASGPVTKAVVVGYSDRAGEQKLYGCYTSPEAFPPAVLRERLREKLPDYMMPAFLEQVESLPVNANGKTDRTRIAPPDLAQYQAEYAAPSNEMERLLCEAFQEAFGLPLVGVDDDFVRLGGDSASAVAVQLRLPETMRISVAALTDLRTPRAIAAAGTAEAIPIAADRKEWKVSYDELWFLKSQATQPDSTRHIINSAYSLSGPLAPARLEEALRRLLRRQRVLRSVYHRDAAGNFSRTLADEPTTVLQRLRAPEGEIPAAYAKLNRAPRLDSGELCRFYLFETGPERHVLCCSFFHSIMDGPGLQIFWDQLAALYADPGADDAEERPDALDFAEWRESNPKYQADREFYDRRFADGFRINAMPAKRPFESAPSPCDGMVGSHFDVAALEKAARRYDVSLFSLLVGALGLTLGRACRSEDVVICLVMNIRMANASLKNSLGMLADRFPIRLQWKKGQTLQEYLSETYRRLTEVTGHQACSGRRWMKEASTDVDHDASPIMNLNYSRETAPPSFPGLRAEAFPLPVLSDLPEALGMLGIVRQTLANGLDTMFLYPTYYFDAAVAEDMNRDFARFVQSIADGDALVL